MLQFVPLRLISVIYPNWREAALEKLWHVCARAELGPRTEQFRTGHIQTVKVNLQAFWYFLGQMFYE